MYLDSEFIGQLVHTWWVWGAEGVPSPILGGDFTPLEPNKRFGMKLAYDLEITKMQQLTKYDGGKIKSAVIFLLGVWTPILGVISPHKNLTSALL